MMMNFKVTGGGKACIPYRNSPKVQFPRLGLDMQIKIVCSISSNYLQLVSEKPFESLFIGKSKVLLSGSGKVLLWLTPFLVIKYCQLKICNWEDTHES